MWCNFAVLQWDVLCKKNPNKNEQTDKQKEKHTKHEEIALVLHKEFITKSYYQNYWILQLILQIKPYLFSYKEHLETVLAIIFKLLEYL